MRASLRLACVCLSLVACGGSNPKPAPTITSIDPDPICSDGTAFTISGTNFDNKATVQVDGADVDASVTDSMHITVTVPQGTLTGGDHAVTVTNPDNKSASGTESGEAKPLMFFVDPNVLSADLTARITVYMSGLTTTIQTISVAQHSDTAPNPNPAVDLTGIAMVTGHPNQAQATVTGGTLTAGTYDVTVDDGVCAATLANGLTIVSAPDITIADVKPPFGDPTLDTAITITTSGYPLTETPRVYLSAGGTATALRAVTWLSATSVQAVVPANVLPAGDYDVIVIDPIDASGGHVGVLAKGFHLIANPPVVTNVTPQSIESATTTPLSVTGSGFATPTAWLQTCTGPAGTVLPATPFQLTVTNAMPTSLTATVTGGTMADGVVCVLRIMDGTPADPNNPCPAGGTCVPYADFSAIAATTNSGNLGAFAGATALPSGRTRLGAVAGHVNAQTRLLYVLGGDDGTEANAKNDVVATQLTVLGDMVGWTAQRNMMTTKRTGAATIRLGQFLYAIGGYDGAAALKSVERARILDPLDVPGVPDIDLTPAAAGVAPGTWVYRITGVRATNYASDPGGETLPSDPLDVTLPDVSSLAGTPLVKVSLSWPAMQNVASYNIYRTSMSGQGAADVQLIGNVAQPATGTTVTFDDTGLATTAQTPLPIGSLGKWHTVGDLNVVRYGAAAAIAHGATTATTDTWYLYVAGGASDPTLATTYDNYEWAKVDITLADGSQTVSTFAYGMETNSTTVMASIGGGRAYLSAYTTDTSVKADIPADTNYVYFGSGMIKGNVNPVAYKGAEVVGKVTTAATSGDMGTLTASLSAATVGGAGAATIAGWLFTLGGWNSGLTISGTSAAELCPTLVGAACTPPAHANWQGGGGGTPTLPRVLLGVIVEAPFLYVLGGSTVSGATDATPSTERTVW
ncbi:MAG: IPT/TIG domain-containing protein [Acidobacteriota bacterium]